MPDTVLRIDADVSQITVKFKKVGDELKNVGEKAAKSFDFTGGLSKTLGDMPKKLFTVAAALTAIGEAARIANDVAAKQTGWAKERNQTELSASAAAMRAGGSAQANLAFIMSNQSKTTTMAGRTQFLSALGQIQEERRGRGIPQLGNREVADLQRIYNQGGDAVFGENGGDILESVRQFPMQPTVALGRRLAGRLGQPYNGQDIYGLIQGNLANVSPGARTALRMQQMQENTARARYEAGQGVAEAQAAVSEEQERWRTEHPYAQAITDAVKGTVGRIPGVGPMIDYGQRAGMVKGAEDHLREINDNTRRAAQRSGNPTLPNLKARDDRGAITP